MVTKSGTISILEDFRLHYNNGKWQRDSPTQGRRPRPAFMSQVPQPLGNRLTASLEMSSRERRNLLHKYGLETDVLLLNILSLRKMHFDRESFAANFFTKSKKLDFQGLSGGSCSDHAVHHVCCWNYSNKNTCQLSWFTWLISVQPKTTSYRSVASGVRLRMGPKPASVLLSRSSQLLLNDDFTYLSSN